MGELDGADGKVRRSWKKDPDGVQANILAVAQAEFASHGLSGARVDEIAEKTRTSKRMLYYYFGDKEGLYRAVLEHAYAEMRSAEHGLNLADLPPAMALRRLVEFTFDHHRGATDFVRLVMIENIHDARHLDGSAQIAAQNSGAILLLQDIYRRGVEAGVFRPGLTAQLLHWQISALCYFNVSNRATFSRLFGEDLFTAAGQARLRAQVADMVLRFAARTPGEGPMIDPQIHDFLAVWDAKWQRVPPGATPAERRAAFEVIAAEMALPAPPDVDAREERWIDNAAGTVRVRLFRHTGGGVQPALVYMHGGAWMQGSPETHADITARIASRARMTVVSVDYALAPEHPFPAAYDQVLAVTRWLCAGVDGTDPARIAIGGDSAGGNLAAAVALAARDEGLPLRAQLLIYPACDFDQSRPSYAENAEGPLLRVAGMDTVNRMYCPDPARLHGDWRVSPLAAPSHAGLPPAYVAVASHDPLRDSGLAYAEALRAAGVPVTLDPGQGLIHGYLRAMGQCAASRESLARMTDWLAAQTA